jgi:RNA polymerase sigma-70 factor (ECF subfamily)
VSDAAATFEPHRRFLVGLAYRMLGSVAEAEDVAQDAFLRWSTAEREDIAEPRAYLARIVSRLCLDRMKSAHAQREQYVGTWLPEPLVEASPDAAPDATTALADDLSVALLLTLERLSPLERAAFLLHDVFDMDYGAIAGVLERTEPAVRQLVTRSREHVRETREPRFAPSPEASEQLTTQFLTALASGDAQALAKHLAADAVLYTDGGGKRRAALNPIYGADKIVRFFASVATKRVISSVRPARINGLSGFVIDAGDGPETLAFELDGDRIVAIYGVRNPDKLRHLALALE